MNFPHALLGPSLLLLLGVAACSSSPEGSAPVGSVSSAVISGESSDASQDAVVLLVHYDPDAGTFGQCTGTLLAPRLVLTARHCVADTDQVAGCDIEGRPLAEGRIRNNRPAKTMYVFTGPNRPDFRGDVAPAGQGEVILDDGSTNLCNHDLALVVLAEPVKDAIIAPIRLDEDVTVGEEFTAVGWGVTERTPSPDIRQQRAGIAITGVGPTEGRFLPVPPNEFAVGEAICSGDSGGPAIAESGAVIGVVSRGGNATAPNQRDPSATCIDAANLYTKVSPFRDLILEGYELAEFEPWLEGGEDPRLAKAGVACADGSECRSGLCLADPAAGGATTCAQACTDGVCPEGLTCTTEGSASVCRAPEPVAPPAATRTTTTSCAGAPVPGDGGVGGLLLAVVAFGLVAARSRRRAP